jgi:hypothetical protein
VNSHKEICLSLKPGGMPLPSSIVVKCAHVAVEASTYLHSLVKTSLQQFEEKMITERNIRLEILRSMKVQNVVDTSMVTEGGNSEERGIDRDDPMLAWDLLHKASISTNNQ